ncbi:MAG: alpha/beta hydrolase [Rubrivivax sp.]|nr:alpha/beta hydrolase [Rubrivivax sp.]
MNRRHVLMTLTPPSLALTLPTLGGCQLAPGAAVSAPAAAAAPASTSPLPRARLGRLERMDRFASRHVDPRPVDVWLPPGYDGQRPHAVLYMHDGQMVFDADTTWNRQAWEADVVAAPLIAAGRLRDFIIVAPHNNGARRHAEFYPQKFLPHLPPAVRTEFSARALQDRPASDAYLRFLVEELKPAIDARYRTRPGREDTVLLGSSMGGLISVYGLLEHPQVFGAAAALSVHWIAIREANEPFPAAALAYLKERLPPPGGLRLYQDRGTTQLDAQYAQAQQRIDSLLQERGFGPPQVVSRVFEGTGHNERDWHARLGIPLEFLLGR